MEAESEELSTRETGIENVIIVGFVRNVQGFETGGVKR